LHREHGKVPGGQAMHDAVETLAARARFDGAELAVFVRVGEMEGAYYIDCGDAQWRSVKVTPGEWRVVQEPRVKFRRAPGMKALPEPKRGGTLDELRRFVNVGNDADWRMLLAWLVMACGPHGPFPVLVLSGEQGSAKTTAARLLRALVDPSTAPVRTMPRDERDLMIAASTSSWVFSLDNVSYLQPWQSDALCRLATGGGLATRALYTDDEEVIHEARRPVIINGIEDFVTRDDLRDRSVTLMLDAIPPERRRDEQSVMLEFEDARRRIFGALLDALAGALKELPGVPKTGLPRMADFARMGIATERALGWPPGSFMEAYDADRAASCAASLEGSPVGQAVLALVARGPFEGTATALLRKLRDSEQALNNGWPRHPKALANSLKRIAPALRAAGVKYTPPKKTGHAGERVLRLESQAEE